MIFMLRDQDYQPYVTHMEIMQALIWSKMSTGLPIEISSAMKGQNFISFCRLDIDIHRYVLEAIINNLKSMIVAGIYYYNCYMDVIYVCVCVCVCVCVFMCVCVCVCMYIYATG